MAEKKTTEKKEKAIKFADMDLKDLKIELQKVYLNVKTGEEKNTTKVRQIKKEIARKLTALNHK